MSKKTVIKCDLCEKEAEYQGGVNEDSPGEDYPFRFECKITVECHALDEGGARRMATNEDHHLCDECVWFMSNRIRAHYFKTIFPCF